MSRSLDQVVLVKPHDRGQRAALIDRGQTSINDVDVDDGSLNASLRIGQGVGQVASGRGDDGVVVASDARQGQLLIYTMNDVVRLHQATPIKTPWGVTWDAQRKLAWVSSTSGNDVKAYRIDSGVPVKAAQVKTQSKVRGVFDAANGALVTVSENGKVNILSAKEIEENLKSMKNQATDDYPVKRD